MTQPLAVADVTGSTLAALDPALPGLVDVLDPRAAAGLLTDLTNRRPSPGGPAEPLELERSGVQYRPGHSCVVTWEQTRGPARGARRATVDVLVLEARPDGVRGRRFVADPDLPGLGEAADGAAMRLRLSGLLGRHVSICSVTPVRYRPGSRCVLRYDVATADASSVLYGKVLRKDVRAFVSTVSGLARRAHQDTSLPAVAPVLGSVPGLGLVVQAQVGGQPLAAGAGRDDLHSWHAVGRSLAGFHRIPPAGLLARRTEDDLAEVRACVPAVRQAAARLGARLERSLDRLAADTPGPGSCTTHGALRTDQMRLDGGRLVLLDLDDLCAAPAERDLANLLAYLRWRAVRRPELATRLSRAGAAVVDGYRDGGGLLDRSVLEWYSRLSLLKIAARRYRRLEVAEWDLVPRLLDEADAPSGRGDRPAPRSASPLSTELVLAPAVQPKRMTELLTPLLAPWAASGARPEVLSARVLAIKPGVRAVVRYDVAGLSIPGGDATPGGGPTVVLGKLYREPERAARLDRNLRQLGVLADDADGGGGAWPGPLALGEAQDAPFPLGWLSAPALAVYLPAEGDPMDRLPADLATTVAGGVGRWLALLHGAAVRFERRVDPAAEVRDAAAWASVVAGSHPDDGPVARELAALLGAREGEAPEALVPLHKDLHQGHVLARRRAGAWRLSVIDFDEARMGDRALDVAHLCANLDLLRESGRPEAAQWRALFLAEYTRRTGWRPGPAARFWYAHSCLKMAKQLATRRGPWPDLTDIERRRLVTWVLAAGRERLR